MKRLLIFTLAFLVAGLAFTYSADAAKMKSLPMKTLKEAVRAQIGPVTDDSKMPIISWGHDEVTIYVKHWGLLSQKGIELDLVLENNFPNQAKSLIEGKFWALRGTAGMINQAAELLEGTEAELIVVYKHSWSKGGDCLIVKPNIKSIKDLRGKVVAFQSPGPHEDYLIKLLADEGMTMSDIIPFRTKDLTEADHTPGNAFLLDEVDAAMVIYPDAIALTEGAVDPVTDDDGNPAIIFTDTSSNDKYISDWIAVRKDYKLANPEIVFNFVHAMFLGQEKVKAIYENKSLHKEDHKKLVELSSEYFFQTKDRTQDAEDMFLPSLTSAGYAINKDFFTNDSHPRSFVNLNKEIQEGLISAGLMSKKVKLTHAGWNYDEMKQGINNTAMVHKKAFKKAEVQKFVDSQTKKGLIKKGQLYELEVLFTPEKTSFDRNDYKDEFKEIVRIVSANGGALVVMEGHVDPTNFVEMYINGVGKETLKKVRQKAKTVSRERAVTAQLEFLKYAEEEGIFVDDSRFTVTGQGIEDPFTGINKKHQVPNPPQTVEEWNRSRRVVIRIIPGAAVEAKTFKKLTLD